MNQRVRTPSAPIPFIDVGAQRRRLGRAIDDAIARVTTHCQFIQGPEVAEFESRLAAFCGARYAVGCASGTDALMLVLMARGIAGMLAARLSVRARRERIAGWPSGATNRSPEALPWACLRPSVFPATTHRA